MKVNVKGIAQNIFTILPNFLHLSDTLWTAQQNLSIGVNIVSREPSQMRSVRRISSGVTILPKSSTMRMMPVDFIYLFFS